MTEDLSSLSVIDGDPKIDVELCTCKLHVTWANDYICHVGQMILYKIKKWLCVGRHTPSPGPLNGSLCMLSPLLLPHVTFLRPCSAPVSPLPELVWYRPT